MNIILSIDPGLTGTGLAVWDEAKWKELVPPLEVCNIYPHPDCRDWQEKANYVCIMVEEKIKILYNIMNYSLAGVHMEFQEFHQGSAKGHAATASGGIAKLSFFTGMVYEQLIYTRRWLKPTLHLPTQWMGQLTDKAMRFRMEQRLGKEVCDSLSIKSHAVDATCLGLYAKGHWLQK